MPLYVSWESNQPPPSTVVRAECVRVCPAVRVLWAESTMLLDRSCGDLYTLKYTPDFHASRGTSIFSDLILLIYGLSLLSSVSLAEMFALVNALISLFLYPYCLLLSLTMPFPYLISPPIIIIFLLKRTVPGIEPRASWPGVGTAPAHPSDLFLIRFVSNA